jgi:uncharacterized membrane protein
MAAGNFDDAIFAATLTPHRSLGRGGFLALIAGFAIMWFATGVFFWSLGAWPVLPFMGVDFLAVTVAFQLSYRAGRSFEEVEVRPHAILVRRVWPSGRAEEFRFNPAWTKMVAEHDDEQGVTRLWLRSRSEALPVGGFLNPEDRTSFAKALGAALAEARR